MKRKIDICSGCKHFIKSIDSYYFVEVFHCELVDYPGYVTYSNDEDGRKEYEQQEIPCHCIMEMEYLVLEQ